LLPFWAKCYSLSRKVLFSVSQSIIVRQITIKNDVSISKSWLRMNKIVHLLSQFPMTFCFWSASIDYIYLLFSSLQLKRTSRRLPLAWFRSPRESAHGTKTGIPAPPLSGPPFRRRLLDLCPSVWLQIGWIGATPTQILWMIPTLFMFGWFYCNGFAPTLNLCLVGGISI